jgi:hypothetical protein
LEKAEKFEMDYNKYTENKLEEEERKQLFGILTQMFEAQRRNPVTDPEDPLFQAQEHIR